MSRRLALTSLFVLAVVPVAHGESALPKVPEGFKAELVLQAPEIEAPTALCVASNGDVYFAEDPMDMRGPPTKNIDKIWLLKGGDPKKRILFADKMWAVMGLEAVRDKLYVVHAPYVSVFTLDQNGLATKREDLFTDLGPPVAGVPSFNDHIPSGIHMGMDGWLYVSIGDKGIPRMTRKEKDVGSVHVAEGHWRYTKEGHFISLEGGGVIRFRPDGSGLEVFASGTRNHLDVPMDEHDRIFVRDNTDDGLGWWTRMMYLQRGAFMGYPWAYTKHPSETLPMVRDFGGGAPCGGWVYLDDGLPETYRGRVFHCEWGQGKVFAVKLAPEGAGFKFVDQITFMDPAGAVKDFRPFTLRPTSDGRGFYVTDWGYASWLDKRKAGRLWKVTYTKDDVKPAPRGQDADSVDQLIGALDHPAHSERLRAQRALAAKNKYVAANVAEQIEKKSLSARATQHGLWVVAEAGGQGWNRLAKHVLSDNADKDVRIELARALSGSKGVSSELLHTLAVNDPDPQVRLHAIGAQASLNIDDLANEKDTRVRHALVHTLRATVPWQSPGTEKNLSGWSLEKENDLLLQGAIWTLTEQFDPRAIVLLTKLAKHDRADIRASAIAALARTHKDRKLYAGTWWGTQPAARKPPARDVAREGTPLVGEAILVALKDTDASVRKAAVTALVEMKDPDTLDPIIKQFASENDTATRIDLVCAVGALAIPRAVVFLAEISGDAKNPELLRLEAIAGLAKADTVAAADALARVAAPSEPVVVQVRSLEALSTMKAGNAKAAATASLKSPESTVRKAAVGALAARGGIEGSLLVPLLEDKSADVRIATARALGTLKARDAVPALVRAAGDEATHFEAIEALTRMPDRRALAAYLAGLGSKNVELRKAAAEALIVVREEALPDVEQLVRRNEVRAEVLPELRNVYSSFSPIHDWKLIGPFPDDGKPYPPEKEQRFDATYRTMDQVARWKPKQADERKHGFVNLEPLFRPNNSVVAYGYTEVNSDAARDAILQLGSDDTIAVWLNGKKIHEFDGDRGWIHDQTKVNVTLEKGINRLLVRCGNRSGPWGFSVAISGDASRYAFLQGGVQKFDLEAFRVYARMNAGDASRGKKLFLDVKGLACIKCHALGNEGGHVGPDLAGVGIKYKREDLMTSVLEPSKTIAQGYETIVLTLANGKTLTGVFKGESADAVNVADAEGKNYAILKKDIDERFFSPLSTMPNGLSDGMTLQDFADVIAFLEARREERTQAQK